MAIATSTVIYEKRNRIAYVTLNRAEEMNALNTEIVNGIHDAFVEYKNDNDALVAILTGMGGRAFSAGMDLKEAAARREATDKGLPWPERRSGGIPSVIRELKIDKPIIAAIDGFCLAGGNELALQCDIRIATAQSTFGFPNPRWSLTAPRDIMEHIARGEAMFLLLTGSRVSSEVALRNGLIHSVHPDRESLLQEADRIAEEIKMCAPLAIQATKELLRLEWEEKVPHEELQKRAAEVGRRVQQSEDSREGPRAFAERRKPNWKMR